MGEYWHPVNITRKEFVHPHTLGEGLKFREWNYRGSFTLARVQELLDLGRWSPDDDARILSDYGGEQPLPGFKCRPMLSEGEVESLYEACSEPPFKDVSRDDGKSCNDDEFVYHWRR
jgi:hypothetical protein